MTKRKISASMTAFGVDHVADNCKICRSQQRWASATREGQRRER